MEKIEIIKILSEKSDDLGVEKFKLLLLKYFSSDTIIDVYGNAPIRYNDTFNYIKKSLEIHNYGRGLIGIFNKLLGTPYSTSLNEGYAAFNNKGELLDFISLENVSGVYLEKDEKIFKPLTVKIIYDDLYRGKIITRLDITDLKTTEEVVELIKIFNEYKANKNG